MANGILIVDKPAGWTSQDVAAKLRGVFHERRIGHSSCHLHMSYLFPKRH